ncbi:MAG: threonine--tRNA ligase [Candidatus Taylorbacteria bacterium RIFCSPHIGHO2_02_FULL_45_28]|uniref:Threonine--tRNA ligase n=1 Tax=Candidatus Taylorbacteria bacterium RIFCSPHIGHO2_12_FULL_45_16 TaxID=1802315 RepID=A0A1G2MZ56_9BACT|nr:MAG: threonine--tRNA ligase [Candidatus Taylorbacteria bacterium RIFCSPHIGHO2_01_FULL_44_110]OHA25490.1 MAG: threonine--tRNA ligase [Candidatus Taylorbacteria bacterium RIFCSPHIGHO2_02_FULL_45_28]OHA29157.1 MAG: threonine--tRNA ligase [Candidatus Taylorbacteria bacterium RIFCSPHIGHO2_12_FULL_45_16]OHA33379.1 MAG: threonine--tRNA ligase [Candidatus Taylorbacteria bacterium RIFCSPLOWO2_01_FULL_45_59]OHA39890.1 MAG: threonine--tRNA ligase [Candidatus Taylorbacteria bacterium RIFCSPLOWO2_02_FULL
MNPPSESLQHMRHTLAHLLAAAVLELFPETKPTIGPAIDNGFYYDFEFKTPITEKNLKDIEKKMHKLLPSWKEMAGKEVSEREARNLFKDNPYKLELIDEIIDKGEKITLYTAGKFTDLCRGGHNENPAKEIPSDSFKLSRLAGAYWRGDEKNTQLTRIYGLAFATKEELDAYETMMKEAEKRDHRRLGKELDIFEFDDDVGPGLPLWLPNGAVLIEELEKLAKETEFKGNYVRVRSPHIAKDALYLKSGHLPYYEESMYPPMTYEGGKYYLKAMNCPHHHKIYAARPKSYRDLPLRLAEYGTNYRHEKSGELFGLMRVRSLQMNDAHIYCTEEQFADEFRAVNDLYLKYFRIFGVEKYIMRFSTHDPNRLGEKFVNEPALWKKTEDMVRKVLVNSKIPFVEVANEAAFYGPKIDVQVWSAIGREFTLATNQVDFAVPARFGLTYTDKDGSLKTPLCIHRAPLGTHERFIGFLIEHYGGNFPLWLSPVQVRVIPVLENHYEAAQKIHDSLRQVMIRSEIDLSNNGFGKKIRNAKNDRVCYTIILGEKDIEAGKVTLESRDKGQVGQLSVEEVLKKLQEEIKERK